MQSKISFLNADFYFDVPSVILYTSVSYIYFQKEQFKNLITFLLIFVVDTKINFRLQFRSSLFKVSPILAWWSLNYTQPIKLCLTFFIKQEIILEGAC